MKYYLYILSCKDGSYYTGISTDLSRRLTEHNGFDKNNKGAKYTRGRRPVVLVYATEFDSRSLASKEEQRIKKLTRSQKEKLIFDLSSEQLS